MREYIHEYRAEVVPEGVDVVEAEETAGAMETQTQVTTRMQSGQETRTERARAQPLCTGRMT